MNYNQRSGGAIFEICLRLPDKDLTKILTDTNENEKSNKIWYHSAHTLSQLTFVFSQLRLI